MNNADRLTDDEKIALGFKGPIILRDAAARGLKVVELRLQPLSAEDFLGLPVPPPAR